MMATVRGWVKTLVWIVILLVCAGVGAFIAYRFPPNPFPPGVRDPGLVPSESPSPSTAELVSWSLRMSSRTTHTYRVGGSCTSDWRMSGRIRLTDPGRVRGRGVARLLLGARCDFPSAQVQAERVVVRIVGRREGDELDLRFQDVSRYPVGSQDLGGFVKTLETFRFSIPERAGAEAREQKRIEDPEGEIHVSVTTIRLGR
jgi:hypothetical protein